MNNECHEGDREDGDRKAGEKEKKKRKLRNERRKIIERNFHSFMILPN